jgi:sugar phosphate isomerase/epimerase
MSPEQFGIDTITFSGALKAKLDAARAAGFTQVMIAARDLAGHPDGVDAAIAEVKASGLRVTGFQFLGDYEGLDGPLAEYKLEIAKQMLRMTQAVGAPFLLCCSSSSSHATGDKAACAADLRKLANLAVPLGVKVAYEALSWGKHTNLIAHAWEMVQRVNSPNLGLVVDSFHWLAADADPTALDSVDPEKLFFVQLSDFMWRATPTFDERRETARHMRVFPGEGAHSEQLAQLVRTLSAMGYRGDYSYEVFNDDYAKMPLDFVNERAMRATNWCLDRVSRQNLPVRRNVCVTAPNLVALHT